jgi:hypothetical protein
MQSTGLRRELRAPFKGRIAERNDVIPSGGPNFREPFGPGRPKGYAHLCHYLSH